MALFLLEMAPISNHNPLVAKKKINHFNPSYLWVSYSLSREPGAFQFLERGELCLEEEWQLASGSLACGLSSSPVGEWWAPYSGLGDTASGLAVLNAF